MIKAIVIAAVGTVIAAAPAFAGPGLVLQGRSLDGIKYQTTTDTLALYAEPQRAPLPTMPATATAIDAELAGKPVQTAWVPGGIRFNGARLNGLKWNGIQWNGFQLNGLTLNGLTLNGLTLNGLTLNGLTLNGKFLNGRFLNSKLFNGTTTGMPQTQDDATFVVAAVTLPDGARIVVD